MTGALKLAALLVTVALTGTGCTQPPEPSPPGTFVVGVREPASLLPARVTDPAGQLITGALWTPLTTHDPRTHAVTPLAADSVTSSDQLLWTIRLRNGARFHDGTAVTARSYVDAWQAAIAERWPGATVLTDVLRVNDMRAVDDTTVELTLSRPFANVALVLSSTALYPLPDSVLSTKDWAAFAMAPVGNGPYRMAEPWNGGARLIRVADGTGKASEIVLRVVDDPRAQFDQVRDGGLDLATAAPGSGHEAMPAEFAGRHLQWPLPDLTYLGFPLSDKRFADPAVRHALALAVDRAALDAGPLDRQVDPARALLPPWVALAARSAQCRPCNHDPAAAKALLEQAEGFTGPVNLYHAPGQEPLARELAGQLRAALGLDVTARPVPDGQPLDSLDGPFLVSRTLFSPTPREPMINIPGYADAGFAELLESADAATDPTERDQLYRVAENQLLRDLPLVPLWSRHGHALWSQRIRVEHADPVRGIDLAAVTPAG